MTHNNTAETPAGRVACTDCLAIADTLEALNNKPCLADYFD